MHDPTPACPKRSAARDAASTAIESETFQSSGGFNSKIIVVTALGSGQSVTRKTITGQGVSWFSGAGGRTQANVRKMVIIAVAMSMRAMLLPSDSSISPKMNVATGNANASVRAPRWMRTKRGQARKPAMIGRQPHVGGLSTDAAHRMSMINTWQMGCTCQKEKRVPTNVYGTTARTMENAGHVRSTEPTGPCRDHINNIATITGRQVRATATHSVLSHVVNCEGEAVSQLTNMYMFMHMYMSMYMYMYMCMCMCMYMLSRNQGTPSLQRLFGD